jgi:hypothetical protein
VIYLTVFAGIITQRLLIDVRSLICFAVVLCALASSLIASESSKVSIGSLALLLAIHVPYLFRLRAWSAETRLIEQAITNIAAALAVAGIVQFFAQFVVGAEIAFLLDQDRYRSIRLDGYNYLNSVFPGIYKANAFVLLEASYLNQFLCLALIVEAIYFGRLFRYILYIAGIFVTFSGTGLLTIAFILPLIVLKMRRYELAAALGIFVILAAIFAETLGTSTFVARTAELSEPGSSGYARFVSPFLYLGEFALSDVRYALFGRGPGTVEETWSRFGIALYAPTWSKLLYEYGVVGTAAYAIFLSSVFSRCGTSIYVKMAVLIQYFLLGGYLSITVVHALILALVAWRPDSHESAGHARTSAGILRTPS